MSRDREAIVATAEEAYPLVWRAPAATRDSPGGVTASAVRPDVMQQISATGVDLHMTDEEVFDLLATASGRHA